MSMGGGRAGWMLMRSFNRDGSVTKQQLPKGIVKRILRFAKPYRRLLAIFLVLIVIDALVSVANPLIYREIIDSGILRRNEGLIIGLAGLVAGLALIDAILSLLQRLVGSLIG